MIGCRSRIWLDYNYSPSVNEYKDFKGKDLYLEIYYQPPNASNGYYYSDSMWVRYTCYPSIRDYISNMYKKSIRQAGFITYESLPYTRSVPALRISVNSISDTLLKIEVLLRLDEGLRFQKEYITRMPPPTNDAEKELQKRAYHMITASAKSFLEDPLFRTSYISSIMDAHSYNNRIVGKNQIDKKYAEVIITSDMQDVRNIPDFNAKMRKDDFAVIIGVESYQGVVKSEYSLNDAMVFKDYLKALGFQERNIQLITNEKATKSGIEKSLEGWLPNRVTSNSEIIVYYSGHGAPDPVTGNSYLLPHDGDPSYLRMTGYPLRRLYDQLAKLNANEVIIVIDSCFSGVGTRSILAQGSRPIVVISEDTVLAKNMVVLTATQGSQIATSSPEKGHGLFTYYFLKAIKDGKSELNEIYQFIKPQIENDAKLQNVQQSPNLIPSPEKISGKFILRN